ncbi:unnamed protein product [Polarella glacialis]|uniref:Uncharacterized protein n=1 Tax=Polarella glacialis TaxID=89957 RepID=A0A813FAI5_POLGL|nr:unnamed protein product [Polarella glacialis]
MLLGNCFPFGCAYNSSRVLLGNCCFSHLHCGSMPYWFSAQFLLLCASGRCCLHRTHRRGRPLYCLGRLVGARLNGIQGSATLHERKELRRFAVTDLAEIPWRRYLRASLELDIIADFGRGKTKVLEWQGMGVRTITTTTTSQVNGA